MKHTPPLGLEACSSRKFFNFVLSHTHTHIHVHVHTHIHVHVHTHVHVQVHTHMYMYMYSHTYILTHTHTHRNYIYLQISLFSFSIGFSAGPLLCQWRLVRKTGIFLFKPRGILIFLLLCIAGSFLVHYFT